MDSKSEASLNVTDVADALVAIDHAAEQGAYRGWHNIRQVIALRDKLEAFVEAANVNTPTPVLE
jgi:hypothetical protein